MGKKKKARNKCLNNFKWTLKQFRNNHFFYKIQKKKCEFFPDVATYLGFAVKNGTYIPKHISDLFVINTPKNIKNLQKALDLINWFSDPIPHLAQIVAPLC